MRHTCFLSFQICWESNGGKPFVDLPSHSNYLRRHILTWTIKEAPNGNNLIYLTVKRCVKDVKSVRVVF